MPEYEPLMAVTGKPGAYRGLKIEHADFLKAVEALGSAAQHAGPLDEKVTQLVQLGASADEIHHALISLTSTIGFPTVRAALSWADDVIGSAGSGKKRSRKAP
jgi:alkylhydroperoxidase/carboxymuconolactone decarboxylase family protein YurZ